MLLEPLQTAGPLRSPGITPVHHYSGPSRHPLAFHRFPGVSGYKVSLLRRFLERDEEGFSSCLAYPCHRAAPTTPPKLLAALVSCDDPCCLRPRNEGSTFGFSFRGPNGFTCVAARGLAHHPRDGFVDRLQKLSFLPSCYPSYGLLTFAPMGLSPTEYASLRWTHQHAGLSRRSPDRRQSRIDVRALAAMLNWRLIMQIKSRK